MASRQQSLQTTCYIHTDKIAKALCLKHNELLCFQCAIDKAHTGDCRITEIQDGNDERVQCILEHLCARETVQEILENNAKHLTKTQELKKILLQEVGDLHKEYSSRLEEMANACTETIQKNADDIEKRILSHNEFLNDHKVQLESNLEKLKNDGASFNEYTKQLTTIQEDLSKESSEKMAEPEGSFKPDAKLRNFFRKQCFGHVLLIHQKHYAVVGETHDDATNKEIPAHQKSPDGNEEECTGSDVYYSGIKPQSVKPKDKEHQGTCKFQENYYSEVESQSENQKKQKGAWKFQDFFKRLGKSDKPGSTATLQTVTPPSMGPEDTALTIPDSKFKMQNLVDKTIAIPDVDSPDTKPTPKFTKLVHLGKNCYGFLADSTILVTEFPDGPTMRKQFPKPICSIVPTGPREMAVLTGEQISKLGIRNGQLKALGSFVVQETITDVTGFDFDFKTSRYAISTIAKVLILDKKGKVMKTCAIEQKADDALQIKSVYDFDCNHVLYLNSNSKTLKSLDCKNDKAGVVWKKKIDEEKFLPKDICMYNDICCVANTSCLATFRLTDGKPVDVHVTCDILSDCLAVCVTDGIAMWTSGSDNQNLSTQVGFIAL